MLTPVNGKDVETSRHLVRLSPLHVTHRLLGVRLLEQAGWQLPEAYTSPEDELATVRARVGVADVSAVGKLIVKGDAEAFLADAFGVVPESPGDMSSVVHQDDTDQPLGQVYVARLATDEFLVLTPPGAERGVVQCLESGIRNPESETPFVTVVDQTSGLAGLTVAGPDSRELLSKLCTLPLGLADFPNHHVAQSSLVKVYTIIVRNDLGEVPAFDLYFDRPYGEYVWASVIDAGTEFGIVPFGWRAKVRLENWGLEIGDGDQSSIANL